MSDVISPANVYTRPEEKPLSGSVWQRDLDVILAGGMPRKLLRYSRYFVNVEVVLPGSPAPCAVDVLCMPVEEFVFETGHDPRPVAGGAEALKKDAAARVLVILRWPCKWPEVNGVPNDVAAVHFSQRTDNLDNELPEVREQAVEELKRWYTAHKNGKGK